VATVGQRLGGAGGNSLRPVDPDANVGEPEQSSVRSGFYVLDVLDVLDVASGEGPGARFRSANKYPASYIRAGLSPSGKLGAGDFAGKEWHTSSYVTDSATGAKTEVHGQRLLAWADDRTIIAWDTGKGAGESEYHQRLVLITVGSGKEVPLSGFRKGTDTSAGRRQPVFARR